MRLLVRLLSTLAVLIAIGLGTGGWYYAGQLLPAPTAEPRDEVVVGAVSASGDEGQLTLEPTSQDLEALDVTFVTDAGEVRLTGEARIEGDRVTRDATLVDGAWPRLGDRGHVDVDTFVGDPRDALGLDFDEVDIPCPLGTCPAWRVPADGEPIAGTWAVFVHGRGATREEANRLLPTVVGEGLNSLVISYRNDPEAPADPDGYSRFGLTEADDLQAAIDHLQEVEGARRFVLVGYSQGGSLVATFLRRSPDAAAVAGVVLDSPLLGLHETLVLQARNRDIPGPVIGPLLVVTKAIADVRGDLDFGALEHWASPDAFAMPTLILHGDADREVPYAPSARLADAAPERIELVTFEGVDHVRGWNSDAARYTGSVAGFLGRALSDPTRADGSDG